MNRYVFLLLTTLAGSAADWPTYRADYARSGVSPDKIATPLVEAWKFQSTHAPQPAWSGEAKADLYNKVYDLNHRQIFDKVFHVAVVDGAVFFGSSADDKVYCLDAATGRERWVFFTEGPVRLAPTVQQGKVYVGSDDGFIYCLSAKEGSLLWKTRPGPRDYRIPGNGRVISAWPVRTSIVVRDGLAYCCAGMFPSEGVYLCALNADNGSEKWKIASHDLPAQGYMLASDTRLYVPSGRNNPIVCDRANGKRLRVVEGSGGTYALLTGDMLIFGPGKTGQLGVVGDNQTDQLASFTGNHMIVTSALSYLHSDQELSALDRGRYLDLAKQKKTLATRQGAIAKLLKGKNVEAAESEKLKNELAESGKNLDLLSKQMESCVLWKKPCDYPFCLILAGDRLVVGGEKEVAVIDAASGELRWKSAVTGKAYGLAAANGRVFVSTDAGTIHCFTETRQHAAANESGEPLFSERRRASLLASPLTK